MPNAVKGKPSKPLSLTKDEWRRLVVEGIVSVKQAREWWLEDKDKQKEAV